MKFVKALPIFLLLCASARGVTRTAASCSATDVQTSVTASADGDTVLVPASSCPGGVTWTGPNAVTITVGITLNGQGVVVAFGGTGTDPGFGNTVLKVTTDAVSSTFITGFTFNGAFINGRAPITVNTTSSSLTFRIFNNTLNYTGSFNAGTFINITGDGPGLIDHNTLTTTINFSEMIHNFGSNTQTATWSSDVVPGSLNAVYLEDNTFTGPANQSSTGTMAIENFNGAKVVFRHNTLNNTGFDAHGLSLASQFQPPNSPNSCAYINTRWLEVYSNTLNFTGTTTNFTPTIVMRGGSGVIYNNTSSGTNLGGTAIQFQADCVTATGPAYPYQDQPGRGITTSGGSSTTNASPIYIWNNSGISSRVYNSSSYIQLNRDYFVSTSQPAMIRCQSAADVGAGCPVSYTYAPAIYPHPLSSPLVLSPNPLAFGSQNVGTTSGALTATFTNNGAGSVVLATPFFALATGNPLEFANTGGTCTGGGTVLAAGTCTAIFKFTPAAAGVRSTVLTVSLNPPGNTASNTLTGTGADTGAPIVALAPSATSFDFGTVTTGSSSGLQLFTLTNSGTATLTITTVVTSDSVSFPISSNTCNGANLAPAASCTWNSQFTPATPAASQTANLTITTNAASNPNVIALSGTGSTVVIPPVSSSPIISAVPLPPQPTITSVSPASTYVAKQGCSQDGHGWANPCTFRVLCTGCDQTTLLSLDGSSVAQSYANGVMTATVPLSALPIPSIVTAHSFSAVNPIPVIN